ncbi:MAG: hypothetical protein NT062_16725 [Proteobacteria bacterium]|nr:hypothetical protein [Pseudomonadota bacterium]
MTRVLFVAALAGCGFHAQGDPVGGSVTLQGQLRDFKTQNVLVDGTATVVVEGQLSPPPVVTVAGVSFTIDGVLENSLVDVVVAVPPTHHATRSSILFVTDNFEEAPVVVDEVTLASLAAAAGATPRAGHGMILAHLVDDAHQPRLGVLRSELALADVGASTVKGPVFLDGTLAVAADQTKTSGEGWVAYFDVLSPGLPTLTAAPNASVNMAAAIPIGDDVVSIAEVIVGTGTTPPLPANVSFATQVFPLFTSLGCVGCHAANGGGKDAGLDLGGGSPHKAYTELVDELRPGTPKFRVDKEHPTQSLVLTMPSREVPPDGHPNITFTGPSDPAYRLIQAWITQGATEN